MSLIKHSLGFCLLFITVMQNSFVISISAQTVSNAETGKTNSVENRIKRIENSLLSPVRIKGEPLGKMNISERMKHYNVPGVSIAVINNGKIEWAKGYGVRELGTDLSVTPETLFQSGSISKPVAALAALKMVQDGKLVLDEDVNTKLASWKMPENEFTKTEKVTLRRLLTHSAGTSIWGFGGYRADAKVLPTVPQILDGSESANTKAVRVIETPGKRSSYSGGGFTVMQLLMTDVSGKTFPQLLSETVFQKVGMKNSTYEQPLPENFHQQAAYAHGPKGEKPPFRWFNHPEMAAAGLWTTPTDLARFVIELQQGFAGKSKKVLSPAMVKQMLSKQMPGWGLGIGLGGEGKNLRFFHGGANQGFRNEMIAYAETGQGAIVMTNGDQGSPLANEILRGIALEYGWADYLPEEKIIIQLDPQKFAPLVGEYDFLGRSKYVVSVEEGKLKLQGNGPSKYELLAESETKFFLRERAGDIVFVKNAEGRVTEMIINVPGQEIRLKKF